MNIDEIIKQWEDKHSSLLNEYSKGNANSEVMQLHRSQMKNILDFINQLKQINGVIQSLPSDEILIELAKNNCMLHRTSDELGFLVTFDLNDLRQFCTKLLKSNVI